MGFLCPRSLLEKLWQFHDNLINKARIEETRRDRRPPFNAAQVLAREAPGRGNKPGEDVLARSGGVVRVPLMSIKDGWQC